MKGKRLLISLLALLIASAPAAVYGQQFDYRSYPELDVNITHLDLKVDIDPAGPALSGVAEYRLEARGVDTDTLVFHAAHMEIKGVQYDREQVKFNLHNDSLLITLPESLERHQDHLLAIEYETVPRFGLLTDARGSLWTSLLPLSNRHWVPVVDHPRVTFSSTLEITVPSGYRAVATGVKMGEEILDVDKVRYTYRSEQAVPATALSFAVGDFELDEASFGVKKITLHTEKRLLAGGQRRHILETARNTLEQAEEVLGREYPYDRLHMVALEDHSGETKWWGASTVFVYGNNGDIETQIRRGIYAQWFGVYQREERWAEAEAVNILQAALHKRLEGTPAQLKRVDDPFPDSLSYLYEAFGPSRWNRLQDRIAAAETPFIHEVINSLPELAKWESGVYSFRHYGEYWYKQTGQPVFELPFETVGGNGEQAGADRVAYRVDYALNATEGRLKLTFGALNGAFEELVSLPLVKISMGKADTAEVTFTGRRDSVVIQVPALIDNVEILSKGRDKLVLDEYKPPSFLLYELRNDTSIAGRVEAARKLGIYTDNPDLQLAISDYLRGNLEPEVRAALLTSYGDITGGAQGTESLFLEALRRDDARVRQAGLYALQKYPDQAAVSEAVHSYALGADSLPLFETAAKVLAEVAGPSSFKEFVNRMVKTDTAGFRAIYSIQVLANTGNTEQAVKQAEFYIDDVYDYEVRARALAILIQHDESDKKWRARMGQLLSDTDPRIRYLTVVGTGNISGMDLLSETLEERMLDEYDERVYRAMQEVVHR